MLGLLRRFWETAPSLRLGQVIAILTAKEDLAAVDDAWLETALGAGIPDKGYQDTPAGHRRQVGLNRLLDLAAGDSTAGEDAKALAQELLQAQAECRNLVDEAQQRLRDTARDKDLIDAVAAAIGFEGDPRELDADGIAGLVRAVSQMTTSPRSLKERRSEAAAGQATMNEGVLALTAWLRRSNEATAALYDVALDLLDQGAVPVETMKAAHRSLEALAWLVLTSSSAMPTPAANGGRP
jgi:hypothetical protein